MISLILNWFIVYSVYYLVNRIYYDKDLSKLYSIIYSGRTEYRDIAKQIKELQKDEKANENDINLLRIQEEIAAVKFKTEIEKFLLVDCMSPYPKIFLLVFITLMVFYFPYVRLEMAFHKEKK